jgi:hypothetical protein
MSALRTGAGPDINLEFYTANWETKHPNLFELLNHRHFICAVGGGSHIVKVPKLLYFEMCVQLIVNLL